MNGALDNVYATTIDQEEVNKLLMEMRDAHGLEAGGEFQAAGQNSIKSGN